MNETTQATQTAQTPPIKPVANNQRCYSEYVNHMVRFYLTSPESIRIDGHTAADINNWMAVQAVFADLNDSERSILTNIYSVRDRRIQDTIADYCRQFDLNPNAVWALLVRVTAKIARQRGLV